MSYYYVATTLYLGIVLLLASLIMNWSWVVEFSIMSLGNSTLVFSLSLEAYNNAFIFTVLIIFSMVYRYSYSYLSTEVYLSRFLAILTLFMLSMCILILSSSLLCSLVGWDGLGVTSLFLILFYYSKSALKASSLTFLMNRVGDCLFILALTQVLLTGEVQICYSCSNFPEELALLLILISITKSAQIPFSTWLPAAMEAPTPVSALVHSSTLVTAGMYLLYRYSAMWVDDSNSKFILSILSLGTCFMAALSAMVENDLKKLIALSTLSQLGFIMFSMSLGLLPQGFLHMLMHAYFKALLFLCAGLVIHSFKGSQSILCMKLSGKQNPLLMSIMSCSLLSMSGLPFLSGFYSKDLILDSLGASEWGVLVFVLMASSFVATILYSARLVWYLMSSSSNWHSMSDSDLEMIKPMMPLVVLASLSGSLLTWLLVEKEFFIETSKVLLLMFLMGVTYMYWLLKDVKSSFFLEKKWNLATFNYLMSNTLFLSAKSYKHSSDLLGLPEILNNQLKAGLNVVSKEMSKTMVHFSGSSELLVFMTTMFWLW